MNHFKIYNFLITVFIISIFIFIGCQDNNTDILPDNGHTDNGFQYKGIITGIDARLCPCCGGYVIKIDSTTYDFDSLPPNANFTLENATFPIYVNLDWHPDTTHCGNYIDITRIEKVK